MTKYQLVHRLQCPAAYKQPRTACNTAQPATLHGLQHHTACNTVPSAKSKRATRELENDGQYICIIQFGKGFMTMRNIDDRKKRRKKEKSQPSERGLTATNCNADAHAESQIREDGLK